MMTIPAEFMSCDKQDLQHRINDGTLLIRRGSLDSQHINRSSPKHGQQQHPEPCSRLRHDRRRPRQQRHTTVVAARDRAEALASLEQQHSVVEKATAAREGLLHKAFSYNQLTRIARWPSTTTTGQSQSSASNSRRGSLKTLATNLLSSPIISHKTRRRRSCSDERSSCTTPRAISPATPSTPPTPRADWDEIDQNGQQQQQQQHGGGLLPSAASVVKALSPLLVVANTMTHKTTSKLLRNSVIRSDSESSGFDAANKTDYIQNSMPILTPQNMPQITQSKFEEEYDIVQKIGEGWFSRVYLTEHRATHQELVLKVINSKSLPVDDFLREYQNSYTLSAHRNVLTVYPDMVFNVENQCWMFATEYAPLGDLTSNVGETGIGEINTKRVAKQIGSALEWVHSKNLCHLDVKLDNILVFRSDFSKVKLCDFGSVKTQGDIVIKKNELLPYCPPELVAKHANEYYQVDRVQDVFQFGIVVYFCLFGILPWQRADPAADPRFAEFCAWRRKRTSKIPKNFKPMSSRSQKLFKKLLDPDPEKRVRLSELTKYTAEDLRWLRKGGSKSLLSLHGNGGADYKGSTPDCHQFISDGISQLTMGSFQSVHSNAVEKNRVLYTLLQHGVETTVDRTQKNSRIIHWIQHGQTTDPQEAQILFQRLTTQQDTESSSGGSDEQQNTQATPATPPPSPQPEPVAL